MNILIVAEGRCPDFVGGAETVIRYLSGELIDRGHRMYTLTRKPRRDLPDYEFLDGVHVCRYAGPPVGSHLRWLYPAFGFWAARARFVKLSDQVPFDAIVFNHPFPALGISSSRRSAGSKKVYMFHSASHLELRAAVPRDGTLWDAGLSLPMVVAKCAERYALRKCDAIVTLSQYMKDRVIHFHGEAAKRIRIIPGGVNTKEFTPVYSTGEKKLLRREFGVPTDAFVLFVAKRLYRGMGLENLIDAMGLLAASKPEKEFLLLLAGDGPLRRKLDDHISRSELGEQVRLLGNVPYRKMASCYRLADLFISTRAEPFGLVILEALACGLPVLSVPAGGAVEILDGLSKNLLFEDEKAGTIAQVILKYLNAKEGLSVLKKQCRRYVVANYSWVRFGELIEDLVQGML